MKREEKEVRMTVFNRISITEEERKFLAELVDAIRDLWDENAESLEDTYINEYDIIKDLAEDGFYEVED